MRIHHLYRQDRARKAGVSRVTITRIEKGFLCRSDTKRKIYRLWDWVCRICPGCFRPPTHNRSDQSPKMPPSLPKTLTLISIRASQSFEALVQYASRKKIALMRSQGPYGAVFKPPESVRKLLVNLFSFPAVMHFLMVGHRAAPWRPIKNTLKFPDSPAIHIMIRVQLHFFNLPGGELAPIGELQRRPLGVGSPGRPGGFLFVLGRLST